VEEASTLSVLLLASIPILAMLIAVLITNFFGVTAAARNVMSHFAAGLVFAIVAVAGSWRSAMNSVRPVKGCGPVMAPRDRWCL